MNSLNKLAAYRKLYNLTQEDVAKYLKISNVSYSYKETGKQDFRLLEAKALSELFNASIEDIFFTDKVNVKFTEIV